MADLVLSVRSLKTHIASDRGLVRAVDGIDFDVPAGETFAIVGESGSGKSMTALSILRLLPSKRARIVEGSILFEGQDLVGASARAMRQIRGGRIGMIFQEPMTALNPVYTVGRQIVEALRSHQSLTRAEAQAEAVRLLDRCGIPAPDQRAASYPHQLSGGMRQRAMIAMAIACRPKLLIADEPTTALDVTIQSQILDLIEELKAELGLGVLLITHNFGVVARTARRTAVMYAGRIVETAETERLFAAPAHPYTRGLLRSIPRLGVKQGGVTPRLVEIPGMVPPLTEERRSCAFAPRCDCAFDPCWQRPPELAPARGEPRHGVRCFASADS